MTQTRNEVLAAVTATFQVSEVAAIMVALDRYGIEPHERERERAQLAIVELSGGSKDKLLQYVQIAKNDYRDILAWKQLGPLPDEEGKQLQKAARALIARWGEK